MDQIDQALAELRQSRAALDALYATKEQKDAAAVAAIHQQSEATDALNVGIAAFNDREAAFVSLIQSTFTSGPPVQPAPAPTAPTSPVVPPATTV